MREVIIRVSEKEFETYFKQDPNVRELIRCKECKWWNGMTEECEYLQEYFSKKGFCEWGKRNDWTANDL